MSTARSLALILVLAIVGWLAVIGLVDVLRFAGAVLP